MPLKVKSHFSGGKVLLSIRGDDGDDGNLGEPIIVVILLEPELPVESLYFIFPSPIIDGGW